MALVKTVEMRVIAEAGDAQRRLDEITAQAKELDGNAIRMRFKLSDAEGRAQLDAIRAQADRLGLKNVSIKVKTDGAGRAIADLLAVREQADRGATMTVRVRRLLGFGGGDGGGGLPNLPGGLPLVGGLPLPAIGAAAAGVAALLPELAGLVSGFAAAGAGLGAFGLVAKSTFTATATAASKVQAAQVAYNAAVGAGVKPATAYRAEQIAIAKAYAELSPQQIALSRQVGVAANSWQHFVQANTGGVAKILTQGIGLLPKVFQSLQPFLKPTEQALGGLLTKLGTGLSSPGFKTFIDSLSKITGPAIGAIGAGIGQVAAQFGKLITVMSGKDVAHAINIAFGAIAGTIGVVTGAVKILMNAWDHASAQVTHGAHQIASAFDTIRHGLAESGHSWAGAFDGLRHAAASAAGGVVSFFSGLPGKIRGIFAGAGGWLTSAGAAIIRSLEGGAKATWGAVSGWISGLGGQIRGFFAGAGGWLVSAGAAVLNGFLSGLMSVWGKITSFIGGIGGWIASHKGPLDADRMLLVPHGQAVIGGLMRGMDSQMPALRAQLAGVTRTVQGTLPAGGYGRGGVQVYNIHVNGIVADPNAAARQVIQLINEYHRHGGGR